MNAANPTYWQGRRVLITGVTGFVGSWLAHKLADLGAQVVGLVRDLPAVSNFGLLKLPQRITTVQGRVEDQELLVRILNEYEIQNSFHLAAQAIVGAAARSPVSTFRSNIEGTWSLLEACRSVRPSCHIVVASSDKAYGMHDAIPYREDFALRPTSPYEVSKACADLVARSFHKAYGLPVAVTRFANLYGGGDLNFSRIVPDTCRSIVLNRNPILRSDGSPQRDYVYIDDAVELYLRLAEHSSDPAIAGEAFNAGGAQPWSVLQVVEKLLELSGKRQLKPEIRGKGSPPGEIPHQALDGSKVEKLLGWRPTTSMADGLGKALSWYEKHRSILEQL